MCLTPDALEQLKGQMLDASIDCIKVINLDGTLRLMNRPGCLALGVDPDKQRFGMLWLDLLPPGIRKAGRRALAQVAQGRPARFPGRSELPGQAVQHWDNQLTPLYDAQGTVTGILCVSRDITAQREAELQLRQTSETDELTGLANRRTFNRYLRQCIASHRESGKCLGLMIVDLDHFKNINDTLGHPAGDHLLRVLGRRLSRLLNGQGMVARLGGDEFAIVLTRLDASCELKEVAEAICQEEARPVTYGGQAINGGLSIGCAVFPEDAVDATGLMKAADSALFALKENGRGGVQMHDHRLQAVARERAGQRQLARRLLREGGMEACYQPRVDMRSGEVVGFEALLRIRGKDGRPAPTCGLAEAFNDYAVAVGLSSRMQAQVLADLSGWQSRGLPLKPVAINAAPVEFLRDDYASRFLTRVQRAGIDPALLEVEVTEQVLAERGRVQVIRALEQLKAAGVRVSLDDFGTGHSSLTRLHDYPIDCLKLDRSFVAALGKDRTGDAIVHAVGQLAPLLGLELVAEGVETVTQARQLLASGYRIAQGHLYWPALPADQVERLLRVPRTGMRGERVHYPQSLLVTI